MRSPLVASGQQNDFPYSLFLIKNVKSHTKMGRRK